MPTSRFARYAAVTSVNVAFGLATLVFLHGFLGWHGVPAATTAIVTSAVPCFVLNRRYVWRRAGRIRVRAEVLPFAFFTFVGVLASSGLVLWAEETSGSAILVYAAHQSAFALLWVMRFVLFEKILWREPRATVRRLPRRTLRPARLVDDLAA